MARRLQYGPSDRQRPTASGPGPRGRGPRRGEGDSPASAPTESARPYAVELSDGQRERLFDLIGEGGHRDRGRLQRARMLLLAEEGHGDMAVAKALGVDRSTVWRVRKRFAQGGCDAGLADNSTRGGPRKFDEDRRDRIVELARSDPPEGFESWTLQLLAERLVEQGVVDAISLATVRSILMDDARRRGGRVWRCWR